MVDILISFFVFPLSAGGFIYVALSTILADLEVDEFYKSYRSPVALLFLEIACTEMIEKFRVRR